VVDSEQVGEPELLTNRFLALDEILPEKIKNATKMDDMITFIESSLSDYGDLTGSWLLIYTRHLPKVGDAYHRV
jgi:hypothetical protein